MLRLSLPRLAAALLILAAGAAWNDAIAGLSSALAGYQELIGPGLATLNRRLTAARLPALIRPWRLTRRRGAQQEARRNPVSG